MLQGLIQLHGSNAFVFMKKAPPWSGAFDVKNFIPSEIQPKI